MPFHSRPSPQRTDRLLWLLPILLVQTACVGTATTTIYRHPPREPTRTAPAPPAQSVVPTPVPEPTAPPPTDTAPEQRTQTSTPPAVLALMDEAGQDLQSGDLDNAATALERAIRIQPKNPKLWHDLAEVRLRQQQPGLAEDLAKKSNLHAQGDDTLIRANWSLIAEARRLLGDAAGADEALRKAGQ
ncbi:Tetratricopeptide repeat-containing protein [Methylomagnum ishizawai]|uniref:Tetratricopeptide repeat-containing protein n=1 Tax=Methylomagnum ishizawai TaxID=1760988 RepID=A0A1Y6D575_9GAMM|nr:tetratricopeptide repeat protein [Methylomagnum ishizawai]SMF95524.1 Tetratricopeptide repeat-containing protein [Methylomagnum ishizawai]